MSLRATIFALTYDRQMAKTEKAGLRAFRERLLAGASGDVLEIGGGTGANLPCYGPAVTSLTITEPQPPMLRRLERAVREHVPANPGRPPGSCARRPRTFPSTTTASTWRCPRWSCAVSTTSPGRCASCAGCCAPAAGLLFIEHVRSGDPGTARLQDRLNWLNRLVVCCDCNRPTLDSIRAAGFTVAQVEHTALPKAPPFVRPAIVGSATAPAAAPSGSTPSAESSSQLTG